MKTRAVILFGLGMLVVLVGLYPFLLGRALREGSGPKRTFELSEETRFLTEEVALDKARETLRLDGLDISEWQPHPDGRTKAPNGRVDQFMGRNVVNSNRGTFMFTRGTNRLVRFVSVELNGRTVACQSSVGR